MLVTATQLVGHLHLGQVEVLCKSPLSLKGYRILEEASPGRIGGRESVGHDGFHGFGLVVAFRFLQFLPRLVLVLFFLIVLTEIAADGFHHRCQLAFVVATIGHEIGHHARRFLPTVVRILKFRAADVCAKDGEKHRNERFVIVF